MHDQPARKGRLICGRVSTAGSIVKRATHMLMGLASGAPVALAWDVPAAGAVGCLWFGMMGGALPDYLDLRSGARRTLRHRGVSHSVWALAGLTAFAWLVLDALARRQGELFPVPPHVVVPWTIAFAAGGLSHLLGDACTRAGIQPFLPLSRVKVWVLPRWLRGRSDGWLNAVAVVCAAMVLGGCLGMVLSR